LTAKNIHHMKKFIPSISIILLFCSFLSAKQSNAQTNAQTNAQVIEKELTLEQVIELALAQSPDAYIAKHTFRASYWNYRSYKAELLPSLSLNATLPNLNRSYQQITGNDGRDIFVSKQDVNNLVSLSLSQNVGFTGGVLSLNSSLSSMYYFSDKSRQYMSNPISITYRQPLFGYNKYKWNRQIEPLKYEEAKKNYIQNVEQIRIKAINLFFDLSLSQINLQMANVNHQNNDTLFKIAKGRYNTGMIAKNELLQIELNYLNSAIALSDGQLELERKKYEMRSFLGFNENVSILLVLPTEAQLIEIDVDKATMYALKNNPEVLTRERELIQAESNVARARTENRFNADLFVSYGLNQSSPYIEEVYLSPDNTQLLRVGLSVPILDWGRGKGQYKMAQSNKEKTDIQVGISKVDFEQNIRLKVKQFNLQDDQLLIAAKSDTIAQMKYDVTLQRFFIGKVDVVNLNIALNEKDSSRRRYISALREYYTFYYEIRRLCLFDFVENHPLEVDFEEII